MGLSSSESVAQKTFQSALHGLGFLVARRGSRSARAPATIDVLLFLLSGFENLHGHVSNRSSESAIALVSYLK